MADDADFSQHLAEQQDAQILQRFRTGMKNALNNTDTTCVECEAEIPAARRRAVPGCTRCVTCQQQHELLAHWRQP